MTHCSELIHNDSLREKQIAGAEKFIRQLYPSEKAANNLVSQDSRWSFPIDTPSMIAASSILYHVKP